MADNRDILIGLLLQPSAIFGCPIHLGGAVAQVVVFPIAAEHDEHSRTQTVKV